jgi:NADPH2:quinone reductase
MRAIVVTELGGPEVMHIEELPTPAPGPGELLVRVKAAGVNPVDTYIRAGVGARPALPYTPGDDGAGELAGFGEGTEESGRRAGDRVYLSGSLTGTYAEYAVCRRDQVHPLPSRTSFVEGAGVGVPYVTAYRALFQRAAARAGETVLVHGATGGVGLAAVQLAAAGGLTVIATGGSVEGRRLALANGASEVLDHGAADHFDAVLQLTHDHGVDVVLEMRSDLNLGRDLPLLARDGRVVCIGNRGSRNEGQVAVNARDLMRCDGIILGMLLPNADRETLAAAHRALDEGLAAGELRPVVTRELPLEEAARAHREVMQSPSLGNIVLTTE